MYFLARDNSAWRGERTASICLQDKIPTLAHACRQRLVVHGLRFYPFSCGRSDVLELNVVGAIDGDTVLDVHRESDVCEDVHYWWKGCHKFCFTRVDVANVKARDVFLR
jgi:hypothetical protein